IFLRSVPNPLHFLKTSGRGAPLKTAALWAEPAFRRALGGTCAGRRGRMVPAACSLRPFADRRRAKRRLARLELRQLRYFVALAEHRHFGKAAEALHISQPSLSQQIRALEADVGTVLVDRTRRRVALTPDGEALRS